MTSRGFRVWAKYGGTLIVRPFAGRQLFNGGAPAVIERTIVFCNKPSNCLCTHFTIIGCSFFLLGSTVAGRKGAWGLSGSVCGSRSLFRRHVALTRTRQQETMPESIFSVSLDTVIRSRTKMPRALELFRRQPAPSFAKCSSKPKWCCDFHLPLSSLNLRGPQRLNLLLQLLIIIPISCSKAECACVRSLRLDCSRTCRPLTCPPSPLHQPPPRAADVPPRS